MRGCLSDAETDVECLVSLAGAVSGKPQFRNPEQTLQNRFQRREFWFVGASLDFCFLNFLRLNFKISY